MDMFHEGIQSRKFDGQSCDARYLWLIREQIGSRVTFIEWKTYSGQGLDEELLCRIFVWTIVVFLLRTR